MDLIDEENTLKAISFFQTLINHRKLFDKDTRPVNFAGNIGRHMERPLKTWFTKRYPNNTDYVKFFIENDSFFTYDKHTGNVDLVRVRSGQTVTVPDRLIKLEAEARSNPDLVSVSNCVTEAELFLFLFKELSDAFNISKDTVVKTSKVVDKLCNEPKYKRLCERLPNFIPKAIANPMKDSKLFETDLKSYLATHYSSVFLFDSNTMSIRWNLPILEELKTFGKEIDNKVFELFKCLAEKYILKCGDLVDRSTHTAAVDVHKLKIEIAKRHPIITDRIFNRKSDNDFNLAMFCGIFPKTFTVKIKTNGPPLICVRRRVTEELNGYSVNGYDSEDDIYVSDDNDGYTNESDLVNNDSFSTMPTENKPLNTAFQTVLSLTDELTVRPKSPNIGQTSTPKKGYIAGQIIQNSFDKMLSDESDAPSQVQNQRIAILTENIDNLRRVLANGEECYRIMKQTTEEKIRNLCQELEQVMAGGHRRDSSLGSSLP